MIVKIHFFKNKFSSVQDKHLYRIFEVLDLLTTRNLLSKYLKGQSFVLFVIKNMVFARI